MIALVQRVQQGRVEVAGVVVCAIGAGMVVLVCAEPADVQVHLANDGPVTIPLRLS